MQLVAPDILQEAQGFSTAVSATAFAVGFIVWLLGWRSHRFWIVLVTTIAAGLVGLSSGPALGTQYLVAGLLLALAAGALALALVRVLAFAAGGVALWFVVRHLAPNWDGGTLVCLLAGGLLGLLLFRVWTMALTSLAGTLVMTYSGLCLAKRLANLDIVTLAETQATVLNWLCGGVAVLGLVVQFLLDRRRAARRGRKPAPVQRPAFAPGTGESSSGSWWKGARQAS